MTKPSRQTKIAWVFGALLLAIGASGCIKVRHIGSSTGKAFHRAFNGQVRGETPSRRWARKPMEAELGTVAANRLTEDDESGSRGKGNKSGFSLPLVRTK